MDPLDPPALKVHQRLLQHQREFMLVGGMPEAVESYRTARSFADVAMIQSSICNTYIDDFSKYARQRDLADLQTIFRTLPKAICNKIKYSNLLPGARSAQVKNSLNLLSMARLLTLIIRSDCTGIPLGANANPQFTKPVFLDVGLVSRLLGVDWLDLQALQDRQLVNEGPLAEQFIGQHLHWDTMNQPSLHYWARESKSSNAEVDYVVARGRLVVPIEVKAGKSGTLKSLHLFMHERRLSTAVRFDLQPPSVQRIRTTASTSYGQEPVSYNLYSLPLYAVDRLPDLLDRVRAEA